MVRVLDVLGTTRHPTGNVKYPQRFVETRAATLHKSGGIDLVERLGERLVA